jgi:thiol:disulfide interchange protein DsbC
MLRSWAFPVVLLMAWYAFGASAGDVEAKLRVAVQGHDSGAQVGAVNPSPVSGMYLTTIDGVSGYVSADGRYFIVGDMLDLASRKNVTEEKRKATRRELLNRIKPEEAIVFAPEKPKYTITVFTDVDCPYCRKLHGEVEELERKGVEVRYVAFPRSGPGTKSWKTMTAVWCAKDEKDRREALTRATRGEEVIVNAGSACRDVLIKKHHALGQKLQIPGTPMIVLGDGTSLGGYMPPDQLLVTLAEHAQSVGRRSEQ